MKGGCRRQSCTLSRTLVANGAGGSSVATEPRRGWHALAWPQEKWGQADTSQGALELPPRGPGWRSQGCPLFLVQAEGMSPSPTRLWACLPAADLLALPTVPRGQRSN